MPVRLKKPIFFKVRIHSVNEVSRLKEIRIHGRGGQGSVTMAQLLAKAAFEGGRWSQGFPSFGVERLGAPVQAFARIGEEKITDRSQVHEPDFVIVQDATLIEVEDILNGLKEGGMILINTSKNPEEVGLKVNGEIVTVDATGIAMEHLGRPIMNTSLAGAFAGVTGLIEKGDLIKVVKEIFPGKIGDKNAAAIEAAYGKVRNDG